MIYNAEKFFWMVKNLLELLKRSMNFFDVLILVAAVYMFSHFDYSNLSTMNIVYIVVFVLWLIMLVVRIFVVHKKTGKQK